MSEKGIRELAERCVENPQPLAERGRTMTNEELLDAYDGRPLGIERTDLRAEILKRMNGLASVVPRCPKCGSDKIGWSILIRGGLEINCGKCSYNFFPCSLENLRQFFSPSPATGQPSQDSTLIGTLIYDMSRVPAAAASSESVAPPQLCKCGAIAASPFHNWPEDPEAHKFEPAEPVSAGGSSAGDQQSVC